MNLNAPAQALRLDGEELTLTRVLLNGKGHAFLMDGSTLVLDKLPESDEPFELELLTS